MQLLQEAQRIEELLQEHDGFRSKGSSMVFFSDCLRGRIRLNQEGFDGWNIYRYDLLW